MKIVPLHPNNRVLAWIEDRLRVLSFLAAHTTHYYAPKNLNVWYYFGVLALVVLVNQLVTGIFLAMHFKPSAAEAFASVEFLLLSAFVVFFEPTFGGLFLEHDNFVAASPLVTPEHIRPVWYFTPYYAMLRVVPDKLAGVIVMFAAVAVLFAVPWLDRGTVRSIRYRGRAYKIALGVFVTAFVLLGTIGFGASGAWIVRAFGAQADVNAIENAVGRVLVAAYFGFFVFVWIYARFGFERTRPLPVRVTGHA